MNAFLERKVIAMLNKISESTNSNQNLTPQTLEKCEILIDEIDDLLSNSQIDYKEDFALETLSKIPETFLVFPKKAHLVEKYLNSFLRNVKTEGLYQIKIHVTYSQLLSQKSNQIDLKSQAKILLIRDSIQHLHKALLLINHEKSRKKYAFMVYNISKIVYQMIRVLFRSGQLSEFTEIVQIINQTLTAQLEEEYGWNGFFSWLLFYCMEDSKTSKNESALILEKLWENSKQNQYFFHDALFRLRVHNSSNSALVWQNIGKEAEKDTTGALRIIYALQSIKSKIILENQIEKELSSLLRIIFPSKNEDLLKPISNTMNDLMTEIAHVAAQNGLIQIAEKVLDFLKKQQQLSSKAYVLMEFAKAELLIRAKSEAIISGNKEQNERMQNRDLEIERRKEALSLLTKALKARIGYINPLFIYEGCVKIWNFSLPFLNEKFKDEVYKPFGVASKNLEDIQSSDFHLRIRLHYELARINFDSGSFELAEEHISKCKKLFNYCETAFDVKKIESLAGKINLICRPIDQSEKTALDEIEEKIAFFQTKIGENVGVFFVEIRQLLNEYFFDTNFSPEALFPDLNNIIQNPNELISEQEAKITIAKNYFYKLIDRKTSIYEELSRIFFEKGFHEYCINICEDFFASIDRQNEKKATDVSSKTDSNQSDLILTKMFSEIYEDQGIQINFAKILYLKAQALIKKLTENEVEFAHEDSNTPSDENKVDNSSKTKIEIINSFIKGTEIAVKLKQTWLIFNAGILVWNIYLPLFKNVQNTQKFHPLTINLFEMFFNSLKNSINLIEARKIVDYDFDNKIQIYGNISILYTRLLELRSDHAKVYLVTEDLLLVPLTPQTRKLVNSIRARVGYMLKPETKGKKTTASLTNQTDQSIFDINSKLEIISNHFNGNVKQNDRLQAIKDCFDLLYELEQGQKDELDLELLCELWTKLANLALNEEKIEYTKLSLSCLEFSFEKSQDTQISSISKYTALGKFLYAKALCHIVEVNGIEKEQHEIILLKSLQKILESIDLCIRMKNNKIFEQIKKFYLIIQTISERFYTPENRRCIIKPIFSLIYYIKIAKEMFENFTKDIQISQILVNLCIFMTRGCLDKEEWELAYMASNLLLEISHPTLKDRIWILKVISLTKKGFEIEKIFEEIKNCNITLQSTLLQEIAWNADSIQSQYQAFTRAIDVMKKENSPMIFEVILNFKEWMLRNDFPMDNIKQSIHFLEKLIHKQSIQRKNQLSKTIESISNLKSNESRNFIDVDKKQSLDEIKSLEENEIYKYFGGGKSSFNQTKKLYPFIEYNVEDCDNLLKVYYISSILVQNLSQRLSFISNSIFFIWKTFYLVFEQFYIFNIQKTNLDKNGKIKANLNIDENIHFKVIKLMPKTQKEWLELTFPSDFLESISKINDPQKFCKEAYKQPLITFHYLNLIMESIYEFCNFTHIAIVIKFVELFAIQIMENDLVSYLPILWTAQLYSKSNNLIKSKEHILKFNKTFKMSAQYFNSEIEKFVKSYSDTCSKTFQLNSITSKTKKTCFLNMYYPFEFWISYAEILFSMHEFSMTKTLLVNSISCCEKSSAEELLGKCQLIIGKIASKNGENEKVKNLFELAGKNIKLLKNWKVFLQYTTDHFTEIGNLSTVWSITEKFENLINQVSEKSIFQYNKLHGQDILAFIQLIRIGVYIEEFSNFEHNFIIESKTLYCDNFKKVMSEYLFLMNKFFELSQNQISLFNFSYAIDIFKKHFKFVFAAKLVNYEFLNEVYIFTGLSFILFEKLLNGFESLHNLETKTVLKDSQNLSDVDINEESRQNNIPNEQEGINSDSSEILNIFKLLKIQYVNFFLTLEKIFRTKGFNFPTVNEKYVQEKYFGKVFSLKVVENYKSVYGKKNEEYVDLFEYKFNQNVCRSWSLIMENVQNASYLLTDLTNIDTSLKALVQLELKITMIFKKEHWRGFELPSKKLISDTDEEEISNSDEKIEKSIQKTKIEEIDEVIFSDETLSFEYFCDLNYFRFNKMRFWMSFFLENTSDDLVLVANLADYQSFNAKEVLHKFYFENIDASNSLKTKYQNFLLTKNNSDLKKLIENNSFMQNFWNHKSFLKNISLFPKNSFFVILEPNFNFSELFCGIVYIGEEEKENIIKYIPVSNGIFILSKIKSFLRKQEIILKEKIDNSDFKEESIFSLMENDIKELTQSMAQITEPFYNIMKSILNKKKMDENGNVKSLEKKKTKGENEAFKFSGLYFFLNIDLINLCVEQVFQSFLEHFNFVSREISSSMFFSKKSSIVAQKQPSLNFSEGFFISHDEVEQKEFEEINSLNTKVNQFCFDGYDFENKYIPDKSEIQRSLERKKICVYKGCMNFFESINSNQLLSIAGQSKVDLFLCFDRIKLLDQNFKKYNNRFKRTSNYVDFRNMICVISILNVKCAVLVRNLSRAPEVGDLLENFLKKLEKECEVSSIVLNDAFYSNFCLVGLPFITVQKELKTKTK